MLELIIDTTNNKEVVVGCSIDGKKDLHTVRLARQKAQVVLPLVTKVLRKHGKKLTDVSAIEVNRGPGSFTGIRVGLSVANVLGRLYGISINQHAPGVSEEPVYE